MPARAQLFWPAVLGHATANLVWMVSPAAGAGFDPWRANVVLLPAGAVFVLLARRAAQ